MEDGDTLMRTLDIKYKTFPGLPGRTHPIDNSRAPIENEKLWKS